MKTKFMAVMGPSGVGKSTIMHELEKLDRRFVLIKTHVTRLLRAGETDRVSLTLEELEAMRAKGEVIRVNRIYGTYFAALPWKPIKKAFAKGMFPMCDYKIPYVADLSAELSGALFSVYLLPTSFDSIRARMLKSWGKVDEARMAEDQKEVQSLDTKYPGLIDFKIYSEEGQVRRVAEEIYYAYLKSLVRPK